MDIEEKDYRSTIISSLPIPLANFMLNQLAIAWLYSADKSISPDLLIQLIAEEAEQQHAQRAAQPKSPKGERGGANKALAAMPGTDPDPEWRGKS